MGEVEALAFAASTAGIGGVGAARNATCSAALERDESPRAPPASWLAATHRARGRSRTPARLQGAAACGVACGGGQRDHDAGSRRGARAARRKGASNAHADTSPAKSSDRRALLGGLHHVHGTPITCRPARSPYEVALPDAAVGGPVQRHHLVPVLAVRFHEPAAPPPPASRSSGLQRVAAHEGDAEGRIVRAESRAPARSELWTTRLVAGAHVGIDHAITRWRTASLKPPCSTRFSSQGGKSSPRQVAAVVGGVESAGPGLPVEAHGVAQAAREDLRRGAVPAGSAAWCCGARPALRTRCSSIPLTRTSVRRPEAQRARPVVAARGSHPRCAGSCRASRPRRVERPRARRRAVSAT